MDRSFLDWPFFEPAHKAYAERLDAWATEALTGLDESDVDATCRALVGRLGADGWLEHCVAQNAGDRLDVRTLCLTRETLARHDGLADFAFAMQGLGTGPISLFGTPAQCEQWLPGVRAGRHIAAFALSEPEAGSDVSALATTAERDGDEYVLNGTKTWISNGGIADVYTVFARTGEAPGAKGLSAFIVPADAPGFSVPERIELMAPHPLGTLQFDGCRIPAENRLAEPGQGFKVAMATLDVFRATVGAAALGFARRALAEALAHTTSRELFGATLAAMQLTQTKLADMAVDVDASALLVYRAAWAKDCHAERVTREASMAKLHATEAAQRVIDAAVQMHGGLGVTSGVPVERLYRDIRALRIYEGASEIQQQVIARQVLAAFDAGNGEGA
ncbi:acyl-CoA dehydrogenase family protein [Arhodomonas sp. AD133]|uniref:acyl-CoA dehydrogenase family protein n=1 Tax=Arhodomonas sp. AD133 TaxID=3415009 RepID=UPI003EC023C5